MEEEPNDRCSLLVRNLRYETSPARIRYYFAKYGKIKDVYLPLDHFSRQPRGFGFVQYYNEEDAERACRELNESTIDGNEIHVIIAQDRRKSPETMRRMLSANKVPFRDYEEYPRSERDFPPSWRGRPDFRGRGRGGRGGYFRSDRGGYRGFEDYKYRDGFYDEFGYGNRGGDYEWGGRGRVRGRGFGRGRGSLRYGNELLKEGHRPRQGSDVDGDTAKEDRYYDDRRRILDRTDRKKDDDIRRHPGNDNEKKGSPVEDDASRRSHNDNEDRRYPADEYASRKHYSDGRKRAEEVENRRADDDNRRRSDDDSKKRNTSENDIKRRNEDSDRKRPLDDDNDSRKRFKSDLHEQKRSVRNPSPYRHRDISPRRYQNTKQNDEKHPPESNSENRKNSTEVSKNEEDRVKERHDTSSNRVPADTDNRRRGSREECDVAKHERTNENVKNRRSRSNSRGFGSRGSHKGSMGTRSRSRS